MKVTISLHYNLIQYRGHNCDGKTRSVDLVKSSNIPSACISMRGMDNTIFDPASSRQLHKQYNFASNLSVSFMAVTTTTKPQPEHFDSPPPRSWQS